MSNRLKIKPSFREKAFKEYEKLKQKVFKEVSEQMLGRASFVTASPRNPVYNCYVCEECAAVKRVRIIAHGTTPFMAICDRCGGNAKSTGFEDIAPDKPCTEEWYRPAFEEFYSLYKRKRSGRLRGESLINHILEGGLLSREVKDVPKSDV